MNANLRNSGYNRAYQVVLLLMVPLIALPDPSVWKSLTFALLLSIVTVFFYRREPVRYMLIPAVITLLALLTHIVLLLV